ncbi:mevalonate kinase [Methanobacterium alcaliphilum]|uniref:mevalonate kinase n=1 Tax=Methanobacterium alcaliphilum TaxID=392018 RepID=UPI00200B6836|nr:mevalonate kinase [Methanobacterium alcaliphilum]MCK9151354.1 mevalonate kinase [Methanobacterium alcaliphilum]
MNSTASAPGKTILFGEHAVVFGKPAIAVAVDKRAEITINKSQNQYTTIKSKDLDFLAEINPDNYYLNLKKGKSGIIKYILQSLLINHDGSPLDVDLKLDMPIGAGLGSSAAVTVATLAALDNYHDKKINIPQIAQKAHQVEIEVQGAASPLDTATSAYGGLIFLSGDGIVSIIKCDLEDSLVIGYTSSRGNTGEMVAGVRKRRDNNPEIMDPVIDSVAKITEKAKKALINDNKNELGELMNINHGLLDAMGVNTRDLSDMVYLARTAGASGSKITGAGGGGSIIAYCPGKVNEVLGILKQNENAIKADFATEGVVVH